MADSEKKTLRYFQCRDFLWDAFESLSRELSCSTDYLINESMRAYLRGRQAGTGTQVSGTSSPQWPPAPSRTSIPPLSPRATSPSLMPSVPAQRGSAVSIPPPLPRGGVPFGAAVGQPRQLSVILNGQKIPVNKPEFIIGRSSKNADLTIKDSNISRRHAAIVQEGGQYIIRDLGSTNGIEYQGQRIESKVIEEGDLIRLCEFDLSFTYQ